MVVSRDLKVFEHIYPQWILGDWYAVDHTFAKPGKYRLFAQFTLPGAQERVETFDIEVTGSRKPGSTSPPPVKAILRKPQNIHTGEDVLFTVDLAGQPIEPYLGAWGHFVFVDQNLNNFIHAHPPDVAGASPDPRRPHIHGVSDGASGPPPSSISFKTNFSVPGKYKLWAEFQAAGQPAAIPFNVEVTAGPTPYRVRPAPALTCSTRSRCRSSVRFRVRACNRSSSEIMPASFSIPPLESTTGRRVNPDSAILVTTSRKGSSGRATTAVLAMSPSISCESPS